MDPASIIGFVDASIDLALKCAGAAKKINDIAFKYKYSRHTALSIAQYLDTMQFAWDRIGAWTEESYGPDANADDDDLIERMGRALEAGALVMDALEEDLLPFNSGVMSSGRRMRLVWNENTLVDHQNRIRDQATSMSLLLQVIQLQALSLFLSCLAFEADIEAPQSYTKGQRRFDPKIGETIQGIRRKRLLDRSFANVYLNPSHRRRRKYPK